MWGKATLAMVVSSEFITVASIRATVIGTRLAMSEADAMADQGRAARPAPRISTVTLADRPARPATSGGALSKATRTGRRWTILIQLPVAFCAGNAEKLEPAPGLKLCTWPGNLR